jgi:hypothetical protein
MFSVGRGPFGKQKKIRLLPELTRHLVYQRRNLAFSLPVNEHCSAEPVPLPDDGPIFDFAFGDEKDWENTTQNYAIHVAHVIADDNVAASFELSFLTDDGDFDIEDGPQKRREAACKPADNLPAFG